MLVWDLTKENDLTMTADGQIAMKTKIDALRVRIDAALQVIKGEMDDSALGVDYFGVIFSDLPLSMKIQEICRVIKQIDEVYEVRFLRAEPNVKENTIAFYFEIESVYGTVDYDNTFENI